MKNIRSGVYLFAVALFLLTIVSACGDEQDEKYLSKEGESCNLSGDCEDGLICREYVCIQNDSDDNTWILTDGDDGDGTNNTGNDGDDTNNNGEDGDQVTSGLQWQDPPIAEIMNREDAKQYCSDLVFDGQDDWRMPNLSELRSLVRNCTFTEEGGACPARNGCLLSNCFIDECYGCNDNSWQGDFCYWKDELSGIPEHKGTIDYCGGWYWSSSIYNTNGGINWGINFLTGGIIYESKDDPFHIRCVRGYER